MARGYRAAMTHDPTHPTPNPGPRSTNPGVDASLDEGSTARHVGPAGPSGPVRALRTLTLVVGVVFLLVGVAGFVPGITTDVGDLTFAGHESGAELLGLFHVSVLHNLVHLAFGVIGVAAARRGRSAAHFLVWGGLVYLVLWVYGLVVVADHATSHANFVPLDDADNWLHLGLGLGMLALGLWGFRALRGGVGSQHPA